MIRAATHADITAICDLIQWAQENGAYARVDGGFDRKLAQKLVAWGLSNMGRKNNAGTLVWVAETPEGILSGIMFGMLNPIYSVGTKLEARDIMFFGRAGIADRMDMAALFRRFIAWAEADERVIEIKVTSSEVLMKNWRDMAPYYKRRGFEPCGEVFVRRIER